MSASSASHLPPSRLSAHLRRLPIIRRWLLVVDYWPPGSTDAAGNRISAPALPGLQRCHGGPGTSWRARFLFFPRDYLGWNLIDDYLRSLCSSTGRRTISLLTSRWRTTPGGLLGALLVRCVIPSGRPGRLATVLTWTSLTTPVGSGFVWTTRPSLNWPLRAFWSAIQTRSPTATFLSWVCHFWRMNRLDPAS